MAEEKKKSVKICPKCKSSDVKVKFNPNIGLGAPAEYGCDSCGFSSVIFPEIDAENKEEAEEKVEELKKEEVKERPKKRRRPKKVDSGEIKKVEELALAPTAD